MVGYGAPSTFINQVVIPIPAAVYGVTTLGILLGIIPKPNVILGVRLRVNASSTGNNNRIDMQADTVIGGVTEFASGVLEWDAGIAGVINMPVFLATMFNENVETQLDILMNVTISAGALTIVDGDVTIYYL